MESGFVVVLAEVLDDGASFGQSPKLFAVETLVAEASVETFHEPVFPWAGGRDIDRFDVLVGEAVLEIVRDKFRAVVGPDELRGAMFGDGRLHQSNDVGGTFQ